MHEPRLIAHDAGNEKSATLAGRIWELFGFGTQYAWILSIVYGICAFKAVESPEWIGWTKLILIGGFAVAYLALFCFRRQTAASLSSRPAIVAAGIAGTLGTVLIVFPLGAPNVVVVVVAAILAGASSATLMTGGNKVWSQLRPERVMMHLATSALVSGALYFVLLALPEPVSSVVICLLPVTGSVILSSTKKSKPRPSSFRRVDPIKKGTAARVLAFVACFSAATGVMLGTANAAGTLSELFADSVVVMMGVPCAGAFAFLCAARLAPATMLTYLDRVGVPLMIVGCIIALAVPEPFMPVGLACIMAGFVVSDLFMWFLNAEMVSRSGRSPLEVLARSCLVEWAALALGFLVTGLAAHFGADGNGMEGLRWLFAVCAVLLVVACNFAFTSVDAVRIIEAHEGAKGEERLAGACGVLAEQYGLSQRESEVMLFLASGRTVPYIQEKLTLSQSTVKTHVRSIYRKLEIDGKQSLIDLVEETAERQA